MSSKRTPRHEGEAGFRLVVEPIFAEAVRQEGLSSVLGLESALARSRMVSGGRGPNYLMEGGAWQSPVRIRPALRGGWLGSLMGDRFLRPRRVLLEFERFRTLTARGVPLSRPVFAASVRQGLFWHSYLATLEEPGTRNAEQWLRDTPDESEKLIAANAIADAVRALHHAGATHGDLHLGNLLLDVASPNAGMAAVILDLDRCQIHEHLSPSDRLRDWMRLERSAEKRGLLSQVTPRVRSRLLSRYCGGDRSLRRALLACLPREQRRIQIHRLTWRRTRATRPNQA